MEGSGQPLIECGSCGQETPEGHFCIRCGAPLDDERVRRSRKRTHFAAASHQHVALPALISTLFPHLPRASHAGFRVALAAGAGVVAGLAAARLFGVALIAAALLLPLLVVVYLIDVDVYEEEPAWAVTVTIVWGAIAGAGFGVLALHVAPSAVDVVVHGGSQYLVIQGLVLPFAGLLVLLVGPLSRSATAVSTTCWTGSRSAHRPPRLSRAPRRSRTGSTSSGSGVQPGGAVAPWIWRLLSLGVALPLLMMGAAGAVCAALWLRYRAPARDAEALGWAGHPAVAVPLAAVLVMGGTVGETFLGPGPWLAWLAAFDVVAIVLLRRAIHVGLLEEALEIPIGPEHVPELRRADGAAHVLRELRHLAAGASQDPATGRGVRRAPQPRPSA